MARLLTDFLKGTLADYNEKTGGKVIKIILVAALLVGLSACAPPIRSNANTAECWLLQCFTIPTALRISGSGISRPLFPIHRVLRASVVSLQLVEQWCGFLGAAPWRDSPH